MIDRRIAEDAIEAKATLVFLMHSGYGSNASLSGRSTALPKLGLAKLPASGATAGEGRGLSGRANCFRTPSYFAFAASRCV